MTTVNSYIVKYLFSISIWWEADCFERPGKGKKTKG